MPPSVETIAAVRSSACTSLRLAWRAVKGVAGYNVSLSFAAIALQK
jgi:hypothetical protein